MREIVNLFYCGRCRDLYLSKTMRVLIATVTAGGGHLAAAAALDEAWRASRPEDLLERVDLMKFFSPLHRKIHADGYLKLVEHAPELWGMVFKKTDHPRRAQKLNRLKRIFPSNSRARFERYLKEFKPDVVLCTHYLPLEILGRLRVSSDRELGASHRASKSQIRIKERGIPTPLIVSIVTDFE